MRKIYIYIFLASVIIASMLITIYFILSPSEKKMKNGYYGKVKSVDEQSIVQKRIINRTISNYDENGNLVESIEDGKKQTYILNDKGKVVTVKAKDWTSSYIYSDEGNLIKIVDFSKGDSVGSIKLEFKYDEKGHKIWQSGYNYEHSFKYDSKDNMIEQMTTDPDKYVHRYLFEYNEIGIEVKRESITISPNGKFSDSIIYYKYDKYGNVIEEKCQSSDGSEFVTQYEYDYDKKGNWERKGYLNDNGTNQYWEKLITYY